MILKGAAAARYLAAPDPAQAGLLIAGPDAVRVAQKRAAAAAALAGPDAEAEMRLTRLTAADVRSDPAALQDALRARGFFPGPRVVMLDDATDGLAPLVAAALDGHAAGDAALIVTAGPLTGKSALKAAFETHRNATAIVLYDDPPGREEIAAEVARAGIGPRAPGADEAIWELGQSLDPGDFRQTLEKVALYKLHDPAPVTAEEVAALAPLATTAALDDLLAAVAEGRPAEVGPLLVRLAAEGGAPVSTCIAATRHFRNLLALSAAPGGPEGAVGRLRPPPPWKQREALVAQARRWGARRAEAALMLLVETDLTLRSASQAPSSALLARALLKLAHVAAR